MQTKEAQIVDLTEQRLLTSLLLFLSLILSKKFVLQMVCKLALVEAPQLEVYTAVWE